MRIFLSAICILFFFTQPAFACTCISGNKEEVWKELKDQDIAILELTPQDMEQAKKSNTYELRNIQTIRGSLPEIFNVKKYDAAPGCTAYLPSYRFITTVKRDSKGNYSIVGCDSSHVLYNLDDQGNLINMEPTLFELYPWWLVYSGFAVLFIGVVVTVRLIKSKNKEA